MRSLLILNQDISGMNKYLFRHLRHDWHLIIEEIGYPPIGLWLARAKSFSFSLKKWKERFVQDALPVYLTSSSVFRQRSRISLNKARRHMANCDVIFLPCPMYGMGLHVFGIPYVVFVSFTLSLSWREWPPWAPFSSAEAFQRRFALERELYSNATKLLTSNENARLSLINDYGVRPDRVVNVGYGANVDGIPPPRDLGNRRKNILFVGKDFRRKGGHVLVKAFPKVRESFNDATLTIIGPSFDQPDAGGKGLRLLGYVGDRTKIYQEYQDATVFCMPSLCEPFGLVFLEAMAHSLPCVGTTVDAIPEIITDGVNGRLVPPGDPDALGDCLIEALSDAQTLTQMGRQARHTVLQRYLWENTANVISRELSTSLVPRIH
jgi:glycosyltransferase involved in cell wall biosynthesis